MMTSEQPPVALTRIPLLQIIFNFVNPHPSNPRVALRKIYQLSTVTSTWKDAMFQTETATVDDQRYLSYRCFPVLIARALTCASELTPHYYDSPLSCLIRYYSAKTHTVNENGPLRLALRIPNSTQDLVLFSSAQHAKQVRVLNLERASNENFIIPHLAEFSNLEHLSLQRWKLMSEALRNVVPTPRLKSLSLSISAKTTTESLAHLVTFSCLETLNISQCDNLTDEGFVHIAKLKSLTTLLCVQNRSLTDLAMSNLVGDDEEGETTRNLPINLSELDISDCFGLTDEALESISELPKLRSLAANKLRNITDDGIGYLVATTGSTLEHLSIRECDGVGDKALQLISDHSQSLQSLDVSCNPSLTDDGMKALLCSSSSLPRLTSLALRSCKQLTDRTLEHISTMSSDDLHSLDISASGRYTDSGIKCICGSAKMQKSLRWLNMSWCTEVAAPEAFHSVSNLECLEYLDVTGNRIVDDNFHAFEKLSKLKTLKVCFCGKLTDAALAILNSSPVLSKLRSGFHYSVDMF